MTRSSRQKFTRKWHRRLGPIVGIQLLLWSLGGLYFSWVHLTLVRSETDMAIIDPPDLKQARYTANIQTVIANSKLTHLEEISLGSLLADPIYRLIQDEAHAEVYHAVTGERLSPISAATAIALAEADFAPAVPVLDAVLVEAVSPGEEYRGPLPAWRVNFDNWKKSALYVSANEGRVISRRSTIWRAFDLLWMFHIMDYKERDNFNNWFLRLASLLGVVTVFSGYYLWYLTTPLLRPNRKKSPPGIS